ncbi:MAG: hypothetical protein SVT56_05230 [Chloroflexota bacterium]|jgi:hypothetical protein|nr:hypothetical protein [Chloroflexota bacterium]
MTKESLHEKYLIEFRNGLWTQIRKKEDSVWQFVAFYMGAVIIAAGLIQEVQNISIDFIIAIFTGLFIFTSWGILIVLDSNSWLQRNLILISNIESEILTEEDFNKLIPKYYANKNDFNYGNLFQIQLIFFSLINFLIIITVSFIIVNDYLNFNFENGLVFCFFSFAASLMYFLIQKYDFDYIKDFYKDRFLTKKDEKEVKEQNYIIKLNTIKRSSKLFFPIINRCIFYINLCLLIYYGFNILDFPFNNVSLWFLPILISLEILKWFFYTILNVNDNYKLIDIFNSLFMLLSIIKIIFFISTLAVWLIIFILCF